MPCAPLISLPGKALVGSPLRYVISPETMLAT